MLPRTPAVLIYLSRRPSGTDMAHDSRWIQPPLPSGYLTELRRWARSWMEQNAPVPADPDTVVLAMTEMVTNSIRHAPGPVEVELTSDSRVLAVRVSDSSPELPYQCTVPVEAEGGRGLILVEQLATRWGVRTHPHGERQCGASSPSRRHRHAETPSGCRPGRLHPGSWRNLEGSRT